MKRISAAPMPTIPVYDIYLCILLGFFFCKNLGNGVLNLFSAVRIILSPRNRLNNMKIDGTTMCLLYAVPR